MAGGVFELAFGVKVLAVLPQRIPSGSIVSPSLRFGAELTLEEARRTLRAFSISTPTVCEHSPERATDNSFSVFMPSWSVATLGAGALSHHQSLRASRPGT